MIKRLVSIFFLIVYSFILIKLLVFKTLSFKIGHLMLNFSGGGPGQANFVPFKTILPYLLGEKGWMITIFELLGNVVLLVPIGFFVSFVCKKMTWQKSLILAATVPFIIEGVQVILRVGIFDIDDVILNGFGVIIGYWMFVAFNRKYFINKILN